MLFCSNFSRSRVSAQGEERREENTSLFFALAHTLRENGLAKKRGGERMSNRTHTTTITENNETAIPIVVVALKNEPQSPLKTKRNNLEIQMVKATRCEGWYGSSSSSECRRKREEMMAHSFMGIMERTKKCGCEESYTTGEVSPPPNAHA